MKRTKWMLALVAVMALPLLGARVGQTAPGFVGTDSQGKTHKLSEYRGKVVVLEWHNQGCPYTKKHYESGNMQKLQKEWTAKGVIWLTVISSAPGEQGYVTAEQENSYLKQTNSTPTAVLLDPTGVIGHLYAAKTTPHMYVISPQGTLVYEGAIDSKPTSDPKDIPGATNWVQAALTEATAGKAVSTPVTTPYGCSVKYAK
jgi:peroxiredoxin